MSLDQKEIKQVQEQLSKMLDVDQEARTERKDGTYDEMAIFAADKENTEKLKELVKKYGWIKITEFGKDAATAAWFIVQHADKDIEFQKEVLSLLDELDSEEVSKHDVAYLTDRILVNEDKLIRYGTQFEDFGDYLIIRPVEDPEGLNERRSSMGMDTIEEHMAIMSEAFGQGVYLSKEEKIKLK